MNVLVLNPAQGNVARDLLKAIEVSLPQARVEVFSSVEELCSRLRQPLERPALGIFHVNEPDLLARLTNLDGLLDDIRLILILDEFNYSSLRLAHVLGPRLITNISEQFADVRAVLARMGSMEAKDHNSPKVLRFPAGKVMPPPNSSAN